MNISITKPGTGTETGTSTGTLKKQDWDQSSGPEMIGTKTGPGPESGPSPEMFSGYSQWDSIH